jgi:hypothetical protein
MNRMERQAIYAGAKPEPVRPVRAMAIIHRATGDSAKAKPAAKPAAQSRKLSGPRYRVERVEDTK